MTCDLCSKRMHHISTVVGIVHIDEHGQEFPCTAVLTPREEAEVLMGGAGLAASTPAYRIAMLRNKQVAVQTDAFQSEANIPKIFANTDEVLDWIHKENRDYARRANAMIKKSKALSEVRRTRPKQKATVTSIGNLSIEDIKL